MKKILYLEADDIIEAGDFFRPLDLVYDGQSDVLMTTSCYSGLPRNHTRWLQVERGGLELWIGGSVSDFNNGMARFGTMYEFVRGDIPQGAILPETEQEREKRIHAARLATVMRVGKYKGHTGADILRCDPSYFQWLIDEGLLVSK